MNKLAAVIGLCVFCTVSSFAQGQILKQVERGVARAGFVQKKSLSAVVNGFLASKILILPGAVILALV